ncbi:MAG TPA: type II CAAX endopeptidase family protein [Actinomycetota bacterium]
MADGSEAARQDGGQELKVRPRPIVGLVIFVVYGAVVLVGALISGYDYDEIADTTDSIIKAIIAPIGVGVIILLLTAHFLGWWKPVFTDEHRSARWTLAMPILVAIAIVVGLASADWGNVDSSLVVWLLIGTLLVGVSEEVLTRGLMLTAFRGGMGEVGAWFWTSVMFGLLHSLNILEGQAVGPTIQQIVFAFAFGSVLYASRRATGTLLVPIVLHGLWDFTSFITNLGNADAVEKVQAASVQTLVAEIAVIVFIVAAVKHTIFRSPGSEQVAG